MSLGRQAIQKAMAHQNVVFPLRIIVNEPLEIFEPRHSGYADHPERTREGYGVGIGYSKPNIRNTVGPNDCIR